MSNLVVESEQLAAAPEQLQVAGGEQLQAQPGRGAQVKGAGGPIRARRAGSEQQKSNHRFSSHLPNRPKKAASPYTLFIKGYLSRNKNSNLSAKEKFSQGANEWKKINKADREKLEKECTRDRERYDREMSIWKSQKDYLKRPPTNYGLFLRDTWASEKAAGRGRRDEFRDISRQASDLWADLSRAEKQKYTNQSNTLRESYQDRVQEIRSTGTLPEINWNNRAEVLGYSPSQLQFQTVNVDNSNGDQEYDEEDDEDEEEDEYDD